MLHQWSYLIILWRFDFDCVSTTAVLFLFFFYFLLFAISSTDPNALVYPLLYFSQLFVALRSISSYVSYTAYGSRRYFHINRINYMRLKLFEMVFSMFTFIHRHSSQYETVDLLISVWMLFVSSSAYYAAFRLPHIHTHTHAHPYIHAANHHSICLIHFIVIYTLIISCDTHDLPSFYTHFNYIFFSFFISSVGFI